MRKKSTAGNWPAPRFPGKTFVLEKTLTGGGILRFIEEEGGQVVHVVTDALDYLVTGYQRGNKKSPEKKRAEELNRNGAGIQLLDEQQFHVRLLPSRDEAILLIEAAPKGLERWRYLWNYWNYATEKLDLNGLNFRGKNLSYCNFCAVTFVGADLRDADLSGCCLRELKDIRFDRASLRQSSFSEANHCSFKNADLTEVRINPAVFDGCDFTGAVLHKIGGSYSRMTDCVFRKADLREANLDKSVLLNLDFTGADLSKARLSQCDFTGAKLTSAKLTGADLTDTVLAGADLRKADLTNAILVNADLTGATIDGATFTGAVVSGLRLGDINPARAKGLDPAHTAFRGHIGPNIQELESVAGQSRRLETEAVIEVAEKTIRLRITSHQNSRSVSTFLGDPSCGYYSQSQSFSDAMIELTRKFILGMLEMDAITVKCSKGPMKAKELQALAVRAWCEAMGIEPPSTGVIQDALLSDKEAKAQRRDEWLAALKAGGNAIKEWNEAVAAAPGSAYGRDAAPQLERHLGAGPFRRVDLKGAKLDGINLNGFDFDGVELEGASLKKAQIGNYSSFRKANFRGANLQGANGGIGRFSGADFAQANMKKAHVRVCTFVNCNFRDADLTGADFAYSDVRGSDFSTAILKDVNWEQTKYDDRTHWPRGFKPPKGLIWKGKGPDPRIK